MLVVVTKEHEERVYTKDVSLLNTLGETMEDYDEFILNTEDGMFIPFGKAELNNHILKKDKLIYFPVYDFCYWLAKDEYREV